MDRILPADNDLLTDDSKNSSVINSSDIPFLESFSSTVDHINYNDNQNGENKSSCEGSDKQLLATKSSSNINDNHLSSVLCQSNENIPNGDDSLTINDHDSVASAVIDSQIDNRPNLVDPELSSNGKNVENGEEMSEITSVSSESIFNDNLPITKPETSDSSLKLTTENDNLSLRVESSITNDIVASNSTNKEKLMNNSENNFIPTIVEIRGGCVDAVEKLNEHISPSNESSSLSSSGIPILNIVSVLGSFKESNSDNGGNVLEKMNDVEKTVPVVHILSDDENDSFSTSNNCLGNPFNNDITIKEEPRDNVCDNDSVTFENELSGSNFTSEIFIKEEKALNPENEDGEVICIEATSKIPLPIPIKMESNIDADKESNTIVTKPTSKKRTSRLSSSKFDDCVLITSGSDADDSSDSRKRNRFSNSDTTIAAATAAGYTCHLCNTVFQEHELLNEHMILHRNNSLIEAKVQNNKPKTKIMKTFTCDICQKRLSTSQSLQQHVLIHRNEKPYACPVCQKDFRHLSNYRMHVQKHKVEQRRRDKQKSQQALDKSVVRGVDFGRLVGPLFMKETLLHQKERGKADAVNTANGGGGNNAAINSAKKIAQKSAASTKESTVLPTHLSFDRPSFKTKENASSNFSSTSSSAAVIIRKRDTASDASKSEDDVRPVKTFNSIENVVMNATRIIVKLDNLDANLLKRKLQTPDISIDRSPKRCRISLSPIAEKCNVKLDEIENIPMDVATESDANTLSAVSDAGHEYETDSVVRHEDNDDPSAECSGSVEALTDSATDHIHGTLTDNELFELLNDDRDAVTPAAVHRSSVSNVANVSPQIAAQLECDRLAAEVVARGNATMTATAASKSSNVIFVQTPRDTSDDTSTTMEYRKDNRNVSDSDSGGGIRVSGFGDGGSGIVADDYEDVDDDQCDEFDAAFHKVAVRRLTLLCKRAAENEGKVESRYLLGPLFWHKALRRAKKRDAQPSATMATTTSSSSSSGSSSATTVAATTAAAASSITTTSGTLKLWPGSRRYGGRSKLDDRRTNDPTKLQSRAENKFRCLLDRAKMMNDLNTMNLIGPLFWRRTLQLAGVRRGDDLRTFMRSEPYSLAGVEFVGDDGSVSVDQLQQTSSSSSSPAPAPPQQVEQPASPSSSRYRSTSAERIPAAVFVDTPTLASAAAAASVPFSSGDVVYDREILDCRQQRIPLTCPSPSQQQQQQQAQQLTPQQLNVPTDALSTTVDDILDNDAIETGSGGGKRLFVQNSSQRTYVVADGNESSSAASSSSFNSSSLCRSSTYKSASSNGVVISAANTKSDSSSILYESLTKPKESKTEYIMSSLSSALPLSSSSVLNVAGAAAVATPTTTTTNPTTVSSGVTLLDTNVGSGGGSGGGGSLIDSGRGDSIFLLGNHQPVTKLDNCLVAGDRFGRKSNDEMGTVSTLASSPAASAAAVTAGATVAATVATVDNVVDEGTKLATLDAGNIILNVDDGGGLQLIAATGGDHRGSIGEATTNYVLVSDETGTMQYMVNVPSGENYGNFELISDGGGGAGSGGGGGGGCASVGGAGGDQVAYAIQFDGENYTAVQFVQQDGGGGGGGGSELSTTDKNGGKEAKLQTDPSKTTFLVSNATTASAIADQTSHIGKELSDFLNLDYGNLLKNVGTNQST